MASWSTLMGRRRDHALGRRAAVLMAATALGGAGVGVLASTSAQASSTPGTDKYQTEYTAVPESFAALLKHRTVSWLCEPSDRTTPPTNSDNGTTNTTTTYENRCSITAKLSVSRYAAHLLRLRSTTLASGDPKVTAVTTTSSLGQGSYEQKDSYVYSFSLPSGLIHTLATKRIEGFSIDGFAMNLAGTASYVQPVNQENSTATQTDTADFSLSFLDSSQRVLQCWLPVGAFQIGVADPHGHKCPGY